MLTSLVVKNYALIKDLEIDFQGGFSIITGETGAGKSILLGALSLLLGQRADTTVLSIPDQKCIVEGNFGIGPYGLQQIFIENDIDYDDNTIIRREINANGKSRAFINDTPVNLTVLKTIGNKLVDIHSQHETLELGDDQFQLQLVDTFADNFEDLHAFLNEFDELRNLQKEYDTLVSNITQYQEEKEYLQIQFEEIEKLKLKEGEELQLEREYEKLTHAEEIKLNLTHVSNLLNGEEMNSLSQVKEAMSSVEKISRFMTEVSELHQRLESVYLELKDISLEIDAKTESVIIDPQQLEYVRDRIDAINRLMLKHQVNTAKELIEIRKRIEQKLGELEDSDFHKEEIQKKIATQHKTVDEMAEQIDTRRLAAIPEIEQVINNLLKQLGMPDGMFKIELMPHEKLRSTGKSTVKFLFSANSASNVKELSKIASGGELSRLMLSLKALMAEKIKLPTIVFDEIDAGVSGEVADKVGNIIRKMADKRQVFNITHLPQVASKGTYHYKVFKENVNGEVYSRIKKLSAEERRTEIAQMLSGEDLSEAAYKNADELLNRNL
jgi:DNA repair protein RecN (Recombination protein N)